MRVDATRTCVVPQRKRRYGPRCHGRRVDGDQADTDVALGPVDSKGSEQREGFEASFEQEDSHTGVAAMSACSAVNTLPRKSSRSDMSASNSSTLKSAEDPTIFD